MDPKILEKSYCGFEFEFITELSNNDLKRKLEKLLDKRIVISDKYHSDITPTSRMFKIEPDFSAGSGGKELITGPIPYTEAVDIFEKITSFIRRFGTTTEKTAFQPNISFDKSLIPSLKHSFNPIKFIIDLNENQIYEKFPKRKNNLYAKSVKKFRSLNSNYVLSESNINTQIIGYPKTKYYGINFEKLVKDYLEVRYIGGEFYEYKSQEIKEIWDSMIWSIWEASNPKTNKFTQENVQYLNEVLDADKQMRKKLASAQAIKESFPDIKFSVDLERNTKFIDNKLYLIKDKIHELFMFNELKEGVINYDSEKGRFQLKNFTLEQAELKSVDLINCKLTNCIVTENSEIHRSEINNSDIENSKLFGNKLKSSRTKDCYIDRKNEAYDCYIKGRAGFFDGQLKSGIFREGYIMSNAKFGNKAEIIEFKKM